MDRAKIKRQLRQLPKEASVAFAARVALRMLPLLAEANPHRSEKGAFWYWGKGKKSTGEFKQQLQHWVNEQFQADAVGALFAGYKGQAGIHN